MSQIRVHGQSERYVHRLLGLNGRLDTIQAAILLAKLDGFCDELEGRKSAAAHYDRLIEKAAIAGVLPITVLPACTSAYAQYTIRAPKRAVVAASMLKAGIPTAIHYPVCLHRQPAFSSAAGERPLPSAEAAAADVLSLPMYPGIEEALQRRIVAALAEAVRGPA